MISATGVARAAALATMVFLAAGAAKAQTHAPWPTDWNNWNDPALWVTVGNPGNAGEWSGWIAEGEGPARICGAVGYTFNMGKFEVTAGQYTEFLNKVAATDTYGLYHTWMDSTDNSAGCGIKRTGSSGSYTYSVPSDWANRPVNWVSWGDAARFANWLANGQPTGTQELTTTEDGSYYLNGAMTGAALMAVTRKASARYVIPSEDEWYKAAYHKNDGVTSDYFYYPTSSNTLPFNVLGNPTDPGNRATLRYGAYTIGLPYFRTEVGEHENSGSPYGTFDQCGNVWEWNEGGVGLEGRNLRGGAYNSGDASRLHAAYRYERSPTDEYYDYGFRVAAVPEPATMGLLALGGLVLLMTRRVAPRTDRP